MIPFSVASKTNGTLRKIPGTDRWVVQEAFVWYIDYENKERAIIVPAGFGTDFGSIPNPASDPLPDKVHSIHTPRLSLYLRRSASYLSKRSRCNSEGSTQS